MSWSGLSAIPLASTAWLRVSICILVPYLQRTHNHCSHRARLSRTQVSTAQYTRVSICLLWASFLLKQLEIRSEERNPSPLTLCHCDVMDKDRTVCVKRTGVTRSLSWTKHLARTERKSPRFPRLKKVICWWSLAVASITLFPAGLMHPCSSKQCHRVRHCGFIISPFPVFHGKRI